MRYMELDITKAKKMVDTLYAAIDKIAEDADMDTVGFSALLIAYAERLLGLYMRSDAYAEMCEEIDNAVHKALIRGSREAAQ